MPKKKPDAQLEQEIEEFLGKTLAANPSRVGDESFAEFIRSSYRHRKNLDHKKQLRHDRERKWAPESNIDTLGKIAMGRREFPNQFSRRMHSGVGTHLRRCMKAGLVKLSPDRKRLQLTDEGYTALVDHLVTHPNAFPMPTGGYSCAVYEPRWP